MLITLIVVAGLYVQHTLEFLSDKPDAEHAGNLVVVEDIGVDRIHRHGGAAGFQHHQIARLHRGHEQNPGVSGKARVNVALRWQK